MPVTHVAVSVPDAATYTVKADNSGLVHYMPDLSADITITLPTPKAAPAACAATNSPASWCASTR